MFIPTRIALAAALILGSVSATLAAANTHHTRTHLPYGRASYAQVPVQPSPYAYAQPWYPNGAAAYAQPEYSTGVARPQTQFEWRWFNYQDQQ